MKKKKLVMKQITVKRRMRQHILSEFVKHLRVNKNKENNRLYGYYKVNSIFTRLILREYCFELRSEQERKKCYLLFSIFKSYDIISNFFLSLQFACTLYNIYV